MARPKKYTVNYFPHQVNHKDTMYILEQKYGNDGYAFWFKLLETLGNTDNHYLDLNDVVRWEFLQAKTRLSGDIVCSILDLLANLQAIDPELWTKNKVVWCQKFVDGIAEVYANRRIPTPERPSFYNQKPIMDVVSTDENTQRRVKKSKEEKSKEDNTSVFFEGLPEWIDVETWNEFLLMRKKAKAVPTDKARELLINDLDKFRAAGDDPNEVINQSIKNGWKGLFPLKYNGGNGNGKNQQHTDDNGTYKASIRQPF